MSEYELYHIDDCGRKVDLSEEQKKLANEAKERSAEKIAEKVEEDPEMTEDKYMAELYSKDHDEYLVNGAILKCSMAKDGYKLLHGKLYNVPSPDTTTVLNVTENPRAKCCGHFYHATKKDRKAEINIPPFRCNCDREPHNDKEWDKLEKDESCLIEGTCKALIDLCDEWDNLPTKKSYMMFWNEDMQGMVPGITMSSMLFCRHGGIITPDESGQTVWPYGVFAIPCADSGGPKGGLTEEQQKANARYIYNFFKKQGWTTEAICGMLGNIQEECDMNPGSWEYWMNEEKGYGLGQWTASKDYLDFAKLTADEVNEMAKNNPQELMDIQLDFFMKTFSSQDDGVALRWYTSNVEYYYKKYPLSDNVPDKEMNVKTFSESTCNCKDLALIFHASYERSGDDKDGLQERVDAAEKWYLYFTGMWGE